MLQLLLRAAADRAPCCWRRRRLRAGALPAGSLRRATVALGPAGAGLAAERDGAWMGLATLGLLWLSAAEAATIAYTMPVWGRAAGLADPGREARSARSCWASCSASAGWRSFSPGAGIEVGLEKLPGMALLFAAAVLALGAVLSKRNPLPMHPVSAMVWQAGLGCLPIFLAAPSRRRIWTVSPARPGSCWAG